MKKTLKLIAKVIMIAIAFAAMVAGLICFVAMRAGYETKLVIGFVGFWVLAILLIWEAITI